MTDEEIMESKIKEIERLVAEFMHCYPNGCHDVGCLNCALDTVDVVGVREFLCDKMFNSRRYPPR